MADTAVRRLCRRRSAGPVKLAEQKSYTFHYPVTVRPEDLSEGGHHLGTDNIVLLLSRARAHVFHSMGLLESDLGDGATGIIIVRSCGELHGRRSCLGRDCRGYAFRRVHAKGLPHLSKDCERWESNCPCRDVRVDPQLPDAACRTHTRRLSEGPPLPSGNIIAAYRSNPIETKKGSLILE